MSPMVEDLIRKRGSVAIECASTRGRRACVEMDYHMVFIPSPFNRGPVPDQVFYTHNPGYIQSLADLFRPWLIF